MKSIKLNNGNINQVINNTISSLKSTGLVVFPTDTVYGLLVDAENQAAVKKLIAFKNRPAGKPISVFTNTELINNLVIISPSQEKIVKDILPGPFTLILPSKHQVSELLESETGTLGVRIPKNDLIKGLVDRFRKPITATSANTAGRSPHYSVVSLLNGITDKQKELIDLIVDAGTLPRNKPSTVVDLSAQEVKVLRQGDVKFKKSLSLISKSAKTTMEIAGKILKENINEKERPLVFIIEGEMGVGKTVFVKGIGERLGVNNIVSPTFVIYYEYGNLYHFDLYQIEEKEEFNHLGIEKILRPGNILCFEWGEKAGEIINILNKKAKIVYVKMEYVNETERKIEVRK